MWLYAIWLLVAGVLSFSVAALFSGWLELRRNVYLALYVPVAGVFIVLFYLWTGTNIRDQLQRNWVWGLVGAVGAGYLVVRNVLGQPASERRRGAAFVLDLLWPGLAYGLIDGLLLSVVPIMTVYHGFSGAVWSKGVVGQIAVGTIALIASLFVALVYHLGYREFRGKEVIWTLVGNGILSLAYLLTGNPLSAVLPHVVMHIASVVHGHETTIQLPPHYGNSNVEGRRK